MSCVYKCKSSDMILIFDISYSIQRVNALRFTFTHVFGLFTHVIPRKETQTYVCLHNLFLKCSNYCESSFL